MLNQAQLIGYLGRDPEVRYTPSGAAVCNFSIATSERWKDKSTGEPVEKTEWHRCTAFDRLAEVCGEYLHKGSLVYVAGKLTTRKWTDSDGVERYTTEIQVREMKMLGGKGGADGDGEGAEPRGRRAATPAPAPSRSAASAPARAPAPASSGTGFDDMDDDIPF